MLTLPEKLKIRLAVNYGWHIKGKIAEAIRGFQATEADGVWHLQRGLRKIDDTRHRAILFTHSLEEEAHAEEFASVYNHYSDRVMTPATYEREDLYGRHEPLWKLFAFVHVGEEDATHRFRYIEQTLEKGRLKSSLGRICDDEEGHVDLTHRMLVEMGATDKEIKTEVRRVRWNRLWEHWMRLGKRVIDSFATVLLSIAYFTMGPFMFLFARKKLASRFVEFDNNRLKLL